VGTSGGKKGVIQSGKRVMLVESRPGRRKEKACLSWGKITSESMQMKRRSWTGGEIKKWDERGI